MSDAVAVPRLALTVKEAAESIGVSARTIYEEAAAGRLRVARIGRCLRVPMDALEAYLGASTTPDTKEPAQAA